MKILVLSDVESKYLWDYFEKDKIKDYDLIISCGDLKPQYLSFLASFTKAPILYVRGNHDDCYDVTPPDGCVCIEDRIYVHDGVRIAGLGGSLKYNNGKNQYTQKEMYKRVRKLWFCIKLKKGIDILVTHAPAAGLNDGDDHVHKGFEAFYEILDKFKPKYFIHGHVHKGYSAVFTRESRYKDTIVINGYERFDVEYNKNDEKYE